MQKDDDKSKNIGLKLKSVHIFYDLVMIKARLNCIIEGYYKFIFVQTKGEFLPLWQILWRKINASAYRRRGYG